MHEAFTVHARADAGLPQDFHGAPLQHTGADAPEYVLPGLPFEQDRLDPLEVQPLGQQQPGRPAADDDDLRAAIRHRRAA